MTTQILGDISKPELSRRLRGDGIYLQVTPFVVHIRSNIEVVTDGLLALYAGHTLLADAGQFADFHVSLTPRRRLGPPQCVFKIDGLEPFSPLPLGEAFALLEWGLNWCVTTHCHKWIAVHSAVLERQGRALIMPAPPGSGKSTLCAALLINGWRLLSDEMALLDPATGLITPAPRPVSLKNESIEIIRKLSPDVVIGPIAHDTMKGTVAHLRVPTDSLLRAREACLPAWVIYPRYVANSPAELTARGKAMSFMQLAQNSFNQSTHGRAGFEALSDLIAGCDCYDFSYGRLEDAVQVFLQLPLPQ